MLTLKIDLPVEGQAHPTVCPGFAPPGSYNVTPCDKETVFLEGFDNTFVVKRTALNDHKQQEKAI